MTDISGIPPTGPSHIPEYSHLPQNVPAQMEMSQSQFNELMLMPMIMQTLVQVEKMKHGEENGGEIHAR